MGKEREGRYEILVQDASGRPCLVIVGDTVRKICYAESHRMRIGPAYCTEMAKILKAEAKYGNALKWFEVIDEFHPEDTPSGALHCPYETFQQKRDVVQFTTPQFRMFSRYMAEGRVKYESEVRV